MLSTKRQFVMETSSHNPASSSFATSSIGPTRGGTTTSMGSSWESSGKSRRLLLKEKVPE